jgi:hypothetical protein
VRDMAPPANQKRRTEETSPLAPQERVGPCYVAARCTTGASVWKQGRVLCPSWLLLSKSVNLLSNGVLLRHEGGIGDQLWPIANFLRELAAGFCHWNRTTATIEGYELISVAGRGSVAVLYSYSVAGQFYSGQFRKSIGLVTPRAEPKISPLIERFPRGARVDALYSPSHPDWSIALLSGTDALWTA